jgi:hypothetical protein
VIGDGSAGEQRKTGLVTVKAQVKDPAGNVLTLIQA